MKYRDLNGPPAKSMQEIVASLKAKQDEQKTGAHGVKDLGANGDVTWNVYDPETGVTLETSMRDRVAALDGLDADLDNLNNNILPSIQDGTYIGDDSISTRHIAALSVGADEIIANEVGAAVGNFVTVNAEQVNSGSFAGETFTGGTFIGSEFLAYDGATQTVRINGVDNLLTGVLRTSTESTGAWLTETTGGGAGLFFEQPGLSSSEQAAIYSNADGAVHVRPRLTGANPVRLTMQDGLGRITAVRETGGTASVGVEKLEPSEVSPGSTSAFIEGPGGEYVTVGGAGGAHISSEGTYPNRSYASFYSDSAVISGPTVEIAGTVYFPNTTNVTNTVNTHIDANGKLWKTTNTSSRRYKKDITPWEPTPEQVLALHPVEWEYIEPVAAYPDGPTEGNRLVGFIAEDVDELGLSELVEYSEDENGTLRPETVRYDRFPAAQQVVLQKHERDISELRSDNAVLRAQIDALTERLDTAGI